MEKNKILKELLNIDFNFSGNISMDSRNIEKGDIFFAINKGNEYIEDVEKLGAFVIYDDKSKKIKNSILVDDTVEFMQELAKKYRQKLNATVIAITGSNGKTTTKDILAHLLNATKTLGNYNNHIGVPYTILNCPIESKYLVLELGMSHEKEIDLLSSISKPDYSIILNIGDSHLEFLKNRENIFKAKSEIIPHTKNKVIVNGEDYYLKTLDLENVYKVNIENVKLDNSGTFFELDNKNYHINLYGKHNALDAAMAIKVLDFLNEKVDDEKLNTIKLTKMRFELINKESNIYINDAYNAAPESVKSSLLTLNEIFKDKDKIIILADMLELGENEIKYHKDLKKVLENIEYKKLYLYGNLMSNIEIEDAIKTNDIDEIREDLKIVENSVIFLKGSRGMRLEKILGSDK